MMVDSSSDSTSLSSRSSKKAEGKQVEKENPALVLPPSLLSSEVGLGTISTGSSTLETVLVQTPLQRTTPLCAESVAAAPAPVETALQLPTVAVDTTTTTTFSQQEEQFSQQQEEPQQKVPSHLKAVHKELCYSPCSRDTAKHEAPASVSETASSLAPVSQSTTSSMVAPSSQSAPKKRVMTAVVMTTSASNCAVDAMAAEKVGKKLKKVSLMNGGGNNGHKNNNNNNHSSSSSSSRFATGRWTDAEHQAFLQGLATYGREWKRVAVHIPTRTSAQVRSHAQKYFAKRQAEQAEQAAAAVAAAAAASVTTSAATAVAVGSGNGSSAQASSDSFRAHVERILSEPETVQAEVNATLLQLRQRYAELQQRLQEQQLRQQQPQQQRRSTNGSRSDDDDRRQPAEGAEPDAHADANSSWTSQSMESLQDSELIALHVLRGGLPHHHAEDGVEQQQPPLPDAAGRRNSSGSSMDSVANQSCHNGHTHQSTAKGSDPATSHANNDNNHLPKL